MDAYLNELVRYLVAQSWQIAVLTMVVAVATFALRRRSAHVRYLLWMIVLAKCLVPPLYMVPVRVLPETVPERVPPVLSGAVWVDEHFSFPSPAVSIFRREPRESVLVPPVPQTSEPRLSVSGWLGVLWIAGAGGYLLMNLLRALRGSRWLRRTRRPPVDDVQADLADLLSAYGIERLPRIWIVEGVGQPFVWGLLRGSIYVPPGFFTIESPQHRRDVLAHELSHVLRFDPAVNTLQVIVQGLFWFHPFVWWANRKIGQEREKACDEMAVARLGAKPKEYSTALVSTLIQAQESTRPVPSLAVAGPVKHIEERIRAMLKPGKRFHKRPSLIAVTTVLLAAVLTVPTALVLTARAETDAPKPQPDTTLSLLEAAEQGNIEQMKSLIAAGADVNAQDRIGITALFYAAGHNHLEAVRLLLAEGADVVNPEMYWTPLHRAAWAGHLEVAKLLIAHKADVNAAAHNGSTPLPHAANNGHQLMVELLLSNGAKVDGGDHPYTPLFCAIDAGSEETVKTLIAHGADVNRRTGEDDYVPLVHAMCQPHTGIVKALIEAGADVNVTDRWGWTVMHHAILYGSPEMRQLLLDAGAEISEIHRAVLEGDLARVKSLIESGTDINTHDTVGNSLVFWAVSLEQREIFDYLLRQGATIADGGPLRRAARKGLPEFVKRLIDEGADVNARAGVRHPLGDAALYGREGVVKLLLAAGADVNLSTEYRGSALTSAARQGRLGLVELLIAHGADVNARYRFGTPLHAAVRAATGVDIIKKLLENGADVNTTDKESGQTPLHLAAQIGRTEAAEVLLAAGADVNAKDNGGYTPLSLIARRYGRREVAELLRRHGGEDVAPSTQTDQPTAQPEQRSADDA